MIARLALTFGTLFALLSGPVSAAPAPDKWDFWDKSDQSSTEVIDHSLWQQVLTAHVKKSDDGINRFAYKDLAASDSDLKALASIWKTWRRSILASTTSWNSRRIG